jgi:hypothetical protein
MRVARWTHYRRAQAGCAANIPPKNIQRATATSPDRCVGPLTAAAHARSRRRQQAQGDEYWIGLKHLPDYNGGETGMNTCPFRNAQIECSRGCQQRISVSLFLGENARAT